MGNPAARVQELFRELQIEDRVQKVSDNVWTHQRGSATVHIVASQNDFVLVTARLVDNLPTQNREGFLKMLLGANSQLAGAFFTVESNESVRLNQVYPTEWLQARELAFLIANVATKADEWDDRLRALVTT
jgi:hypothetical protein